MVSTLLTDKQVVGQIGEDLACRFMINKGFVVIARNYRKKWGEIDIVTQSTKTGQYCFVEVKTVSGDLSGNMSAYVNRETKNSGEYRAEDNVHPWKLQRLYRAIQSYLLENNVLPETPWQLDVVTVILDREHKKSKIKRLENVMG